MKALLDANIIWFQIEYITNASKKPTLMKWNIFDIILNIILAPNKALINLKI